MLYSIIILTNHFYTNACPYLCILLDDDRRGSSLPRLFVWGSVLVLCFSFLLLYKKKKGFYVKIHSISNRKIIIMNMRVSTGRVLY